jgi:glucose-6-phosphate isomerase
MTSIKVDLSKAYKQVPEAEINSLSTEIQKCFSALTNKTGLGNDFLGWVELPSSVEKSLLLRIMSEADRIIRKSRVIVVIGIGGSYLGARAVIDALKHPFNCISEGSKYPQIIYAGNNLSEDYHAELIALLDKKDYSVIVISKSGTTTEPAIAFRLIKAHLEKKYGQKNAKERIIAVTDKEKGALKKLAISEGYPTFDIPDDVGGRYSVLTPVGLLPIAAAGIDIEKLIDGAANMEKQLLAESTLEINPAFRYAAMRYALYKKGKTTEVLASYLPGLQYFSEWWKQLFGESEGKEGKGIFPASVSFTADLHSMGQYMQEGIRNIFETVISVENSKHELRIPSDNDNLDGLNFLAGKRLSEVNSMAELGTMLAHVDGQVPNIKISISKLDEENLGALIYFFEFACGLSGYLLGVNPFDQPGVEAYKNNMFALLGKPGFEKQTEKIKSKLKI